MKWPWKAARYGRQQPLDICLSKHRCLYTKHKTANGLLPLHGGATRIYVQVTSFKSTIFDRKGICTSANTNRLAVLTVNKSSTSYWRWFSACWGWVARRNQVLKAVTKWGQSSTFRVEKLRHCCNNSFASDMGSVERIFRNVTSCSKYSDL